MEQGKAIYPTRDLRVVSLVPALSAQRSDRPWSWMPWPAPVLRALDIVVNHPLTPQIAPIFILFGLPLLAFLATGPIAASVSSALHMFSSLWTWASGSSSRDGREKYSKEKGESKKLRKKDIRSRSGQIANGHANGHASGSSGMS
jgi:hypothetical protein